MVITDQHIAQLQAFFQKKPVFRAWIFGSQARREANKDSDVDILVELDYDQHIGWEFVSMRLELEELLQTKVDLVSSEGLSPFIGPYIEAEKQLIYEHFTKRQGAA
jgi:predicted nucleotidyltransferase